MRIVLLVVLLAGCASSPQRIAPLPTSTASYRGWSCSELSAEMSRVNESLALLAVRQDRAANADVAITTLGLVLWPVWLGLAATDDYDYEIARLKGEGHALRAAIIDTCRADG